MMQILNFNGLHQNRKLYNFQETGDTPNSYIGGGISVSLPITQ